MINKNHEKRLAALEAQQTDRAKAAAPMTDDELYHMVYMAFTGRSLFFDTTGLCRAYWPGDEGSEYGEWLNAVAESMNDMRHDNGMQPFLPLSTEDATLALALLREGVIVVTQGKEHFDASYNVESAHCGYLLAQHMARTLGEAFQVFEDSGGKVEAFICEGVIEVLERYIAAEYTAS